MPGKPEARGPARLVVAAPAFLPTAQTHVQGSGGSKTMIKHKGNCRKNARTDYFTNEEFMSTNRSQAEASRRDRLTDG